MCTFLPPATAQSRSASLAFGPDALESDYTPRFCLRCRCSLPSPGMRLTPLFLLSTASRSLSHSLCRLPCSLPPSVSLSVSPRLSSPERKRDFAAGRRMKRQRERRRKLNGEKRSRGKGMTSQTIRDMH
jgi:hypothetical protein